MTQSCAETGTVTEELAEGRIAVVVHRAEACGSCEARGACEALGGKKDDITLTVENTLGAAVGDEVLLTMSEVAVVSASATVYMIPAVNLILGGLAGAGLSGILGTDRDAAVLLGAGLGLLVGFVLSGNIGGKLAQDPQYVPTLLEIRHRETSTH